MELNGFWSSVSSFYIQNSTFTFKKLTSTPLQMPKKKKKAIAYVRQTLDNWEAVS